MGLCRSMTLTARLRRAFTSSRRLLNNISVQVVVTIISALFLRILRLTHASLFFTVCRLCVGHRLEVFATKLELGSRSVPRVGSQSRGHLGLEGRRQQTTGLLWLDMTLVRLAMGGTTHRVAAATGSLVGLSSTRALFLLLERHGELRRDRWSNLTRYRFRSDASITRGDN